ncbi:MAG TPA: hypothetical protein IAC66_07565 [Candidatus Aphodousia gallistercoris]|nr:hypothetical protein [Candidatus Aphodousia gallistercoris]
MALNYSLEALIFERKRSIAGIVPDVTIIEEHTDSVTVTKHPVDTGANIADHAYKNPAVVRCQFGWSDSSRLINSLLDFSIFKGMQTTADIYEFLQDLQKKRQPFALRTGKRYYPQVILTELRVSTTAESESCLLVDCTFEELLVARMQIVSLAPEYQKDASKTASMKNGGQRNPIPVQGAFRS